MKYSKVAQFFKVTPVAKAALFSMAVFSQSSFGALYQVTEIQTQDISRNAFATAINDSGDVLMSVNLDTNFPLSEYNIPIDLSLIDFDSEAIADVLTDVDSARNGNFNLDDYLAILRSIQALQNFSSQQPLVPWLSYLSENGSVSYVPGLDEENADYGGMTKAVETFAEAINDNGVIVGNSEGPPVKVEYTNENDDDLTFVLRDFDKRGFVDLNGTVIGLMSDSELAGGFTEANDINNSLQVAGTEIYDPTEAFQDGVDICLDEEQRGDQPEELCLNSFYRAAQSGFTLTDISILVNGHQRRAVVWNLDSDGNVTDKTTYVSPIERADDDTRLFVTEAFAINENGVAVGRTVEYHEENEDIPRQYAAVFNNGETVTFTDVNEYENSRANDINDNNIVTGFGTRTINGVNRTKFFVYDFDNNQVTFPDDFFSGSSSEAKGINNSGQVVGDGEVDTNISGARRRNGFLYDVNDGTFQNLNDLLACDSPYTVVQANAINDAGQIAAVAVARRSQRDVQGNLLLQEDGTETIIDALVTIVLNPVPGGQIDDCSDQPDSNTPVQERSGSTGLWSFLLLPLVFLRRSKKQK